MKPAQAHVLELCAPGNHKSSCMAGTMALLKGGRNWVFLSHKGRAFLLYWGVGILSWRLRGGIEGFYYVYCWFSKSGGFDFFFRFWKQNSPKLCLKIQIKSNSFKCVKMKPTFKLVKIKWGLKFGLCNTSSNCFSHTFKSNHGAQAVVMWSKTFNDFFSNQRLGKRSIFSEIDSYTAG